MKSNQLVKIMWKIRGQENPLDRSNSYTDGVYGFCLIWKFNLEP